MNGPLSHRWPAATVGVALLAVSGSGLTAHVADKTGSDTVTLHLATVEGDVNPSGMYNAPQVFVDSLESVSGGQLQVDVTTTYDDGAPDAESRLVESIASGSVDGGWPATRAFANAGIDGLQAIEAPMTITNFAAEKELVSSSTADTVLAAARGLGRRGARPRRGSVATTIRRRRTAACGGGLGGRTISRSSTLPSRPTPSPHSEGSRRASG